MNLLENKVSLRKLPHLIWGGFLLLCGMTSCLDDLDFSSSSDDLLEFSQDTIKMDTVISGLPTNTYTFQVYNPNGKALRLSQVFLGKGSDSPFRVNVDGSFLQNGRGGDFEIDSKDSLRVFLFLNAPDRDKDEAVEESDELVFVTEGGATQRVFLSAFGQSVISLRGVVLCKDTLLNARRPYHVLDSMVVEQNVTLRLGPGVKLYFHPDVILKVKGRLLAEGSLEEPIMFRGDRLGFMFSNQPYDRIPGQWGGILFEKSSFGSHLNYCDIHSGTYGLLCDSSSIEREKLRIENSVVHNMSKDVLNVRSSKVFVGNSQLTNAGGNCVTLRGGHSTFVHCTIGNFYAFVGGRGVALDFSNFDGDTRLPLYNAAFYNSIITGYSKDEVMGGRNERYEEDAFNYLFSSCLLDTPEYEDEKVLNCFWDNDDTEVNREKNFFPEFDLKQLVFSFRLAKNSKALHHADPEVSRKYYPLDKNGRSRFLDDGPDIGCFEADTTQYEKK